MPKVARSGAHTVGTFQMYPFFRPPSTTSAYIHHIYRANPTYLWSKDIFLLKIYMCSYTVIAPIPGICIYSLELNIAPIFPGIYIYCTHPWNLCILHPYSLEFVYIAPIPGIIYIRDGSYGLLRRPIRINTLLIRHTRIIRKRIFAILGGTLGLHQPPSNHHELSPQPPEHYNASW